MGTVLWMTWPTGNHQPQPSRSFSGSVMASGVVFQNGSFEGNMVPSYEGQDFQRVGLDSTAIPGWTVTAGNVDWTGNGLWQAAEGSKSVDLDGAEETAGAISQTFDTHLGGIYVVTFAMSGNPGNPNVSPIKTMTVDAAGTTTSYIYNTSTQGTTFGAMNYQTQTFNFTATGPSTTLTFTSTTASGWGPVIDNVVITETNANGPACKNSGWKTMTDRFSTPFKNQGDCVSYYATGEKNLAN